MEHMTPLILVPARLEGIAVRPASFDSRTTLVSLVRFRGYSLTIDTNYHVGLIEKHEARH